NALASRDVPTIVNAGTAAATTISDSGAGIAISAGTLAVDSQAALGGPATTISASRSSGNVGALRGTNSPLTIGNPIEVGINGGPGFIVSGCQPITFTSPLTFRTTASNLQINTPASVTFDVPTGHAMDLGSVAAVTITNMAGNTTTISDKIIGGTTAS